MRQFWDVIFLGVRTLNEYDEGVKFGQIFMIARDAKY